MNRLVKGSSCLRALRKATLVLTAFSLGMGGCTSSQPSAPTQQEQEVQGTTIAIAAADLTPPDADTTQNGRRSALSGPSALAFSYTDVKFIRIDVKETGTNGNVLYVNFDLAFVAGVWSGTLPFLPKDVPLTFSAKALDKDRNLIFDGTVNQTLSGPGQKILFTLAPANHNKPIQLPRIRKISVPKELGSDQSGNVSFTVEATTGDTLSYVITPADVGGSFYPVSGTIKLEATTGTFVSQYVSPSVTTEQNFEHTVKVTNAAGHSVSTTFKTKVKPTGSTDGVTGIGVNVLFSPVINSVSAQRLQDTNSGKVLFKAIVADDGDLSTLAYNWDFTPTVGTSFTPVPDFMEGGLTNPATLENYTQDVQGKVELAVTDATGATTLLSYALTPNQFPNNPFEEGNTTGINTIRAGESHTCALLSTGDIRCWGLGDYGQLGYGNTFEVGNTPGTLPHTAGDVPLVGKATKIALGQNHTCALLSTGFVRCWGFNTNGQLGFNSTAHVGDGEQIASMGYVNFGGIATQIAAGQNHTCVLLDTGKVRCWGLNTNGQLGYGSKVAENQAIGDDEQPYDAGDVEVGAPVKDIVAGGNFTCALTTQGKVRCWGQNHVGQLGTNNTTQYGDTEFPSAGVDVNLGGLAVQVSAGQNHACALLENGYLRCWGYNYYGQLGDGTGTTRLTPGGDVPTGSKVLQVATGNNHTCALLSTGTIKCWGYNNWGQLGYGDRTNLTSPLTNSVNFSGATAYRVTTGANHTCALLSTGGARCWGYNNYGQLGYGNTSPIGDDEQVASKDDIQVLSPTLTALPPTGQAL